MALFRVALLVAIVCCCVIARSAEAAKLGSYNIDPKLVSSSGLSAGAFFAIQFHVAFSSELIGVGVFAGGPYYCAEGSVSQAMVNCMYVPSTDISKLISEAKDFASKKYIDSLDNLNGAKVYLYSGSKDTVVNPTIVHNAEKWYQYFNANTHGDYTTPSQHCIPTVNFGNKCDMLMTPFINKCDVPGAENALRWIYGDYIRNNSVSAVSSNLLSFEQTEFHADGLASVGFIYVPTACRNGATCALHFSFHGCNQNYDTTQGAFVQHAGFNELAEANNIIVVYPQATKIMLKNPEGCYDWWGYGSKDYAFKTGPQMDAVHRMMKRIMGTN